MSAISTSDWIMMGGAMVGGLGLTLFGLQLASRHVKESLGDSLRPVLRSATGNRFLAFVTGVVGTALLSSSTAMSLLALELVGSGDMGFGESVGVALGIHVGSTVAAQLVALKLTKYGLFLIGFGHFSGSVVGASVAQALRGLGIMFLGMETMSRAMKPLQSHEGFLNLLAALDDPFVGTAAGIGVTLVVQSSATVVGLAVKLAESGTLPLRAGLGLVLGTNIGTCSTAVLSSLQADHNAKRFAFAYTLVKVVGALVALLTLAPIEAMLHNIAPTSTPPQLIALAHTLLNVAIAVVALPLTDLIASVATLCIPEPPKPHND